ncbi:MAG: hypothetical protein PHY93_08300 [Bacteriovorax sp.]|nr:hypothetical protein [Bacteriovorax sp.]
MKLLIAFIFVSLNFIPPAKAGWSASEYWDESYSPKLKIICDKDESLCNQLCNIETGCEINQVVCRDCIGTSILMTNIFEGMGTSYRSTSENISTYEFVDFLKQGMYVTFSSKSIYNQTDSYDSATLKEKFLSLCPENTDNALVFFSLGHASNVLDEVKYVTCDSNIFRMNDNPDIVVNESPRLKMNFHFKVH